MNLKQIGGTVRLLNKSGGEFVISHGPDVISVGLHEWHTHERFRGLADTHEFAALSALVYGREIMNLDVPTGWSYDAELSERPRLSRFLYVLKTLKYGVWHHATRNQAALVFRGTVFTEPWDWYTNARWVTRFIPYIWDHYDQVRLGIAELIRATRAKYPEATIITAGHSLGGGLAQQAAYACSDVKKVYAFNSSPVTGWRSVPARDREVNRKGIEIYRIYEQGEILAYVRFVLKSVFSTSIEHPKIVEVRFNFGQDTPIREHAMESFAKSLRAAADAAGTAVR